MGRPAPAARCAGVLHAREGRALRAAVGIPVGPGSFELERLEDALESLKAYTPDLTHLVLIDDDEERQQLGPVRRWDPARVTVLHVPAAPRSRVANDRMTTSSLCIMRWLAKAQVDYLVKLDTDALAINDFRPSLERAIRARPEVGVWGAYRENEIGGEARDFGPAARPLLFACLPLRPRRGPLRLEQALIGRRAVSRRFLRRALREARRNGYKLGEHCLGGSYAVTHDAAAAMLRRGYLDDALATYGCNVNEDAVVSLLARACGFELGSLVAPGEAFAVKHRGLLAEPEELERRGNAIVHSVKADGPDGERDLRARFSALRDLRRRAA